MDRIDVAQFIHERAEAIECFSQALFCSPVPHRTRTNKQLDSSRLNDCDSTTATAMSDYGSSLLRYRRPAAVNLRSSTLRQRDRVVRRLRGRNARCNDDSLGATAAAKIAQHIDSYVTSQNSNNNDNSTDALHQGRARSHYTGDLASRGDEKRVSGASLFVSSSARRAVRRQIHSHFCATRTRLEKQELQRKRCWRLRLRRRRPAWRRRCVRRVALRYGTVQPLCPCLSGTWKSRTSKHMTRSLCRTQWLPSHVHLCNRCHYVTQTHSLTAHRVHGKDAQLRCRRHTDESLLCIAKHNTNCGHTMVRKEESMCSSRDVKLNACAMAAGAHALGIRTVDTPNVRQRNNTNAHVDLMRLDQPEDEEQQLQSQQQKQQQKQKRGARHRGRVRLCHTRLAVADSVRRKCHRCLTRWASRLTELKRPPPVSSSRDPVAGFLADLSHYCIYHITPRYGAIGSHALSSHPQTKQKKLAVVDEYDEDEVQQQVQEKDNHTLHQPHEGDVHEAEVNVWGELNLKAVAQAINFVGVSACGEPPEECMRQKGDSSTDGTVWVRDAKRRGSKVDDDVDEAASEREYVKKRDVHTRVLHGHMWSALPGSSRSSGSSSSQQSKSNGFMRCGGRHVVPVTLIALYSIPEATTQTALSLSSSSRVVVMGYVLTATAPVRWGRRARNSCHVRLINHWSPCAAVPMSASLFELWYAPSASLRQQDVHSSMAQLCLSTVRRVLAHPSVCTSPSSASETGTSSTYAVTRSKATSTRSASAPASVSITALMMPGIASSMSCRRDAHRLSDSVWHVLLIHSSGESWLTGAPPGGATRRHDLLLRSNKSLRACHFRHARLLFGALLHIYNNNSDAYRSSATIDHRDSYNHSNSDDVTHDQQQQQHRRSTQSIVTLSRGFRPGVRTLALKERNTLLHQLGRPAYPDDYDVIVMHHTSLLPCSDRPNTSSSVFDLVRRTNMHDNTGACSAQTNSVRNSSRDAEKRHDGAPCATRGSSELPTLRVAQQREGRAACAALRYYGNLSNAPHRVLVRAHHSNRVLRSVHAHAGTWLLAITHSVAAPARPVPSTCHEHEDTGRWTSLACASSTRQQRTTHKEKGVLAVQRVGVVTSPEPYFIDRLGCRAVMVWCCFDTSAAMYTTHVKRQEVNSSYVLCRAAEAQQLLRWSSATGDGNVRAELPLPRKRVRQERDTQPGCSAYSLAQHAAKSQAQLYAALCDESYCTLAEIVDLFV